MKIQKRKTPSKKLVIISILSLVIIAGGVAAYFLSTRQQDKTSKSAGPAASDTKQAEELAKNPDNKETQVNTDVVPTPETNEGQKSTVSMVASANVSGDKLYIRGGLNGVVVDDGQCYATIKSSTGASLRKDTTLLQNASTTDCKTIIVNVSELNPGSWTVTLTYSSDTMEGTSNEASFEIN